MRGDAGRIDLVIHRCRPADGARQHEMIREDLAAGPIVAQQWIGTRDVVR